MPRSEASPREKRRGAALGRALADHRGGSGRSAERVAVDAEVSVETVRRIERGQVPNPGVFTIAAIAKVLEVGLDQLTSDALAAAEGTSE
jgi:transcriptional regulator with XRE-family HTH domain